ncbi:hypothetical protein AciM339_0167 [Aciduliprofundum sp. MAR08-339]|uniref:hypothetical protein n=1 Tax=Aciduliprofundum sp. (strain MAR08-339) TaxID=673860 RepID=UPI0002A4A6D6|nr:hypothetical protein AciM339_0167 [Aciduliprofundum sp. MAR08-339]
MVKNVEEILKESEKIMPSEDMVIEVMRDIMKDQVKEYIKERIDKNPKVKDEIHEAMMMYLNAKIKELEATALLTKALGELGVVSLPPEMKKEFVANLYKMFQKEIDEILEKTL